MNVTLKLHTIIQALENIDSASLHGLCDDLIFAGALIPNFNHKPILPTGWNPSKHHTIPSPADSIVELDDGLCIFEYSREEDWVRKLKRDVETIKQWTEKESHVLVRFIFITTRDIGNKKLDDGEGNKLSPKEYIGKKLCRFNVQANVFGQNSLLVPLQNSDYFYIRRRWLNISDDYFQSLKSFELYHIKQAQDRHIYLEKFVETSSRKQSINALEEFVVQADVRVLLIHSQGGIGKTRFVLEVLKRVGKQDENIDILFNQRKKHVNVDEVIPEISEGTKSLIVLDDAHLIDNLTDFENILLERNLAKIILVTRPTARESVKQAFSYRAEELELTPLDRKSSIELLKGNLENPLQDQHLRHTARICEENPLLIGITTHLINAGVVQSYRDLKTDDLVRNYLETILADLNQYNRINRNPYEPYLALLFLFKPFSVDDVKTRSLIQSLVNIDKIAERLLRRDLERCAVLERHGSTLWLYPDLLGEYLVKTTFFANPPILDFEEIFSEISSSHIEDVFKTLRELDNAQANQFLKGWTQSLSTDVESQDNDELSDNLRLLEIIASIVPDETLEIIDYLLKPESEKPPKTREDLWSPTPREHRHVLSQCLRILENPDLKCRTFNETLEMLLTMHFYKPEAEGYSTLRKKAFDAIVATAAHDLTLWQQGYGYTIQQQMFEKAQKWNQEDLEKYLPLILGVCRNLLQSEMRSEYADSEGFVWSRNPLAVTDDLIRLRKEVISMLQSIFNEVKASKQIKIIHVLNCATEFPELGDFREDMRTMIQANAKVLVNFYLALLKDDATLEVEVLQEIEGQAYYLKTWKAVDIMLIRRLLRALQSHEYYQLYRTLAGDASLFWHEEGKSYDEIQTETTERIKEFANAITHENLIEWFEKIDRIAETFTNSLNQDKSRFYRLLFEIGEGKPHIARILIDKSITEDNALKRFAAEFLRGIRKSDCPNIAQNYVREWLSGEDKMLLLQVPKTYWKVDEKSLDAGDVEIFETLQNCRMEDEKQRQELDRSIMSNIRWIYKKNPEKTSAIICQIVKRGDQRSISHHMHELWWSREQIDLSQWDLWVFKEILEKFVDLPALDPNAIDILAQYGQRAPFELVRFFECRVEKQKQMQGGDFLSYQAIPSHLDSIAKMYRAHSKYSEVINHIMEWFQREDSDYDRAASNLISCISPDLDESLKQTLLDHIRSGREENILAILKVLEELSETSVSDELCKEAVRHSANQRQLLERVESLILSRVRSWLGTDGGVSTFQHLRARIIPWREDEDPHVSAFAQRIIPKIESRIEYGRKRAAEDEIKRKKGLQ